MLSIEDALVRVQDEYVDPDGYDWTRVELRDYERAQTKVMFTEPRQPRVVDEEGDVTRLPQVCAVMSRFSDAAIFPGRVTTFHHGQVGSTGQVLWSHYSDV